MGQIPAGKWLGAAREASIGRCHFSPVAPALSQPINATSNSSEHNDGKSSPRNRKRITGILR